jgi:ATP-dependent exoDNAse (exonuclease V) beta subunit
VVWWDPSRLRLDVEASQGISNETLLTGVSESSRLDYDAWRAARRKAITRGATPSVEVANPTDMADPPKSIEVEIVHADGRGERPYGPRFGSLVHALLRATIVDDAGVGQAAAAFGRTLGCDEPELDAAVRAVRSALAHPLLERARAAQRCYRELPVTLRMDEAHVMEGAIDLAFEENGTWVVIDYKTDAPAGARLVQYRRQVGWYGEALSRITGRPVRCYLMTV